MEEAKKEAERKGRKYKAPEPTAAEKVQRTSVPFFSFYVFGRRVGAEGRGRGAV